MGTTSASSNSGIRLAGGPLGYAARTGKISPSSESLTARRPPPELSRKSRSTNGYRASSEDATVHVIVSDGRSYGKRTAGVIGCREESHLDFGATVHLLNSRDRLNLLKDAVADRTGMAGRQRLDRVRDRHQGIAAPMISRRRRAALIR